MKNSTIMLSTYISIHLSHIIELCGGGGECRSGVWEERLWMLVELYCHTIPSFATAENSPNRHGR